MLVRRRRWATLFLIMNETFNPEKIKKQFAKALAEEHLETAFDKFIIIGYNQDERSECITNCTEEQIILLLEIFKNQYGIGEPSSEL